MTPRTLMAFEGGDPFLVRGAALNRDATVAGLALETAVGGRGALSLSYDGQMGADATDHRLRLDLRLRF